MSGNNKKNILSTTVLLIVLKRLLRLDIAVFYSSIEGKKCVFCNKIKVLSEVFYTKNIGRMLKKQNLLAFLQ